MLQEDKQKDKIKTISQLLWVLPYLLTVRVTVAGAMRTRGSQDTEMDAGSVFSGFSPKSDIDLHWHKLLSSSAPLQSQIDRSVSTLGQQRTNQNTVTQYEICCLKWNEVVNLRLNNGSTKTACKLFLWMLLNYFCKGLYENDWGGEGVWPSWFNV